MQLCKTSKGAPYRIALALLLSWALVGLPFQLPSGVGEVSAQIVASQATRVTPLLPDDVATAVAEYSETDGFGIIRVLQRLGLRDATIVSELRTLSPLQQLQWAYSSVVAQDEKSAADFLQKFVSVVAQTTPSILSDTAINSVIRVRGDEPDNYDFTRRRVSSVEPPGDASVARAIAAITEVVTSRGSPVSVRGLFARRLALTDNQVLDAILRFGGTREAVAGILAGLPNPPQKQKLAEIARDIIKAVPSARSSSTLCEAVFRWIGLDDPSAGEWFQIREIAVENMEGGRLNVGDTQKTNAMALSVRLRRDYAQMVRKYAATGLAMSPGEIERMHFEYIKREPDAAAMWGFSVIGLKRDLDFERYVKDSARSERERFVSDSYDLIREKFGRSLTGAERKALSKVVNEKADETDWEAKVRDHGPKPYHGYMEYVRLNRFEESARASQYFRSTPVSRGIGKYCPA